MMLFMLVRLTLSPVRISTNPFLHSIISLASLLDCDSFTLGSSTPLLHLFYNFIVRVCRVRWPGECVSPNIVDINIWLYIPQVPESDCGCYSNVSICFCLCAVLYSPFVVVFDNSQSSFAFSPSR